MSYEQYTSNHPFTISTQNDNKNIQLISDHIIFEDPDAISRELFSYLLTDNLSSSSSPSSQDTNGTFPSMHSNNPLFPSPLNNSIYNPPITMDNRYNNYPSLNQLSYDLNMHTSQPPISFISHQHSSQLQHTSPPSDLQFVGNKKRPRRKHDEIQRNFDCIHPNCNKSYGTLSNLNHHITMQKHGSKRLATEFE